jgi:ABC-type multidrug transport system ATPase subunit
MIRLGGNNFFKYLSENTFIYTESDLIPSSSLLIAIGRIFYFSLLKGGGIYNENKLKYCIFNHTMIFIIQFFIYAFILLLFQKRFFEKIYHEIIVSIFFRRAILNEMQNSISDNRIIISDNEKKYTTKIINLIKNYFICCGKNIRAVDKMNLSLEPNEKFGLLGYNGSGKTTTFKSITNEIFFDEGEIELFNKKVTKNFNEIRTNIGYCPQENALFEYLTVEEILLYYIKLKNVNESIKEISERFGLEKYLKTWCTNLSGGNKRKLNFAIALMSYPKILLLDEPSTGVDPDSRRIMWKNINELSYNIEEYNLIISTHSIEEAEILCDTVSWLKLGKFVCVGNPEKLKIEYSAGYYLYINFNYNKFQNNDFNNDIEKIKTKFINFVKGENIINKAIDEKPILINSINEINIILDNINEYILSIELKDIGRDGSYNFFIHMNEDKKGEFFGIILNMKKSNNFISEVSINMESLENILTKY